MMKPNFVWNKVELSVDFECQYLLQKIAMIMILVSMETSDNELLENRWLRNTSLGPDWEMLVQNWKIGETRDFLVGVQIWNFFKS